MTNIQIISMKIGSVYLQGLANIKSVENLNNGALAIPSFIFSVPSENEFLNSLICSVLEIRSLCEALREVAQKKESSSWRISKRDLTVTVTSVNSNEGKSTPPEYWTWINIELNDTIESIPLSVWELRSTIKQLDFFIESVESECFKIMKEKNFTLAKQRMIERKNEVAS